MLRLFRMAVCGVMSFGSSVSLQSRLDIDSQVSTDKKDEKKKDKMTLAVEKIARNSALMMTATNSVARANKKAKIAGKQYEIAKYQLRVAKKRFQKADKDLKLVS